MKKIPLIIAFLCLALACDETLYNPIPNYPVDVTINLDFLDTDLPGLYSHKTIITPRIEAERGKLGYGGILVINGIGEKVNNIFAYDAACPKEVNRNIRVVADDEGRCKCPKCGSIFFIADGRGLPESGTELYLRSYSVQDLGDARKFRITN